MQRRTVRGFASLVLGAALLVGSLFSGVGSRASAQEPALVLYGSVAAGAAPLPSRVRATVGDVACGSAEVSNIGGGTGFYTVVVVSSDTKAGCGVNGAAVKVSLQSGEIDPGIGATQVLFRAGAVVHLDLSTVPTMLTGSFVGQLPTGAGVAYLRWTGASGTPIEQATVTIGRAVEQISFWDVSKQTFRNYTPGAPSSAQAYGVVDTDDIVLVRLAP